MRVDGWCADISESLLAPPLPPQTSLEQGKQPVADKVVVRRAERTGRALFLKGSVPHCDWPDPGQCKLFCEDDAAAPAGSAAGSGDAVERETQLARALDSPGAASAQQDPGRTGA